MKKAADPTAYLYAAIESETERVRVWKLRSWLFGERPTQAKRKEYREKATKAAMAAAFNAGLSKRTPTQHELEAAVSVAFSKDEKDEVGSIFIGIITGIIVRLIMDWLLKGKSLPNERGETSGVN